MDNTLSSKVILFIAFQMTQNKHNGPICHTAFLFSPTKEPVEYNEFIVYNLSFFLI